MNINKWISRNLLFILLFFVSSPHTIFTMEQSSYSEEEQEILHKIAHDQPIVDPVKRYMALRKAIKKNATEVVKLFIQHSQDGVNSYVTTQKTYTLLHCAVENNNYKLVKYLLADKNIKVNCLTNHKKTPLHYAFEQGNKKIIKELLSHPNIDLSQVKYKIPFSDIIENTFSNLDDIYLPIHHLTHNNNILTTDLLLSKHPTEINTPSVNHMLLPLHIAIFNKHYSLSLLLLTKYGKYLENINHQDYFGRTILDLAANNQKKNNEWHVVIHYIHNIYKTPYALKKTKKHSHFTL